MAGFLTFNPASMFDRFTALPIQIYSYASRPRRIHRFGERIDRRAPRDSAGDELNRDLHPQQVPAALVTMVTEDEARDDMTEHGTLPVQADQAAGDTMIAPPRPAHTEHGGREHKPLDPLIAVELDIYYGDFHAVRGVDMLIGRNEITALIGPSGCGKSTVIRCFDRMNDLIPSARVEGKVLFHGQDLYAKDVDPIEVRRRSAWCSRNPTRFQSRSSTMSLTVPRSSGRSCPRRRWPSGSSRR